LVVGPHGAGKSSVLQVAAGLVRPVRGRHRLFGKELASLSEKERVACRMRVGVVFGEGGRLFSQMTVAQNLALPLLYHEGLGEASVEERVTEVLALLDLEPWGRRFPGELPRGIARRAGLARALMRRPDVLLLDDPLGAATPGEETWWTAFVRGESPGLRPRTVVVAGVDPQPWRDIATRFAQVRGGRWGVFEATAGGGSGLRPAVGG
jgi:ABC-type transporter Mla maintaining outer membrane lipid asymmetry ATPase subunit MlaF